MIDIVFDYETRSRVSLGSTNVYRYGDDESTSILCCAFDDGWGQTLWIPGMDLPEYLEEARLWAWNAEFEWVIYQKAVRDYGWPDKPLEHFRCLQAYAGYYGLGRALDAACKMLGMEGKTAEGKKVLKRLMQPIPNGKRKGEWDNDPEKFAELYKYALRDAKLERDIAEKLWKLPYPRSLVQAWQTNIRINTRGLPMDRAFIDRAAEISKKKLEQINQAARAVAGITDPKDKFSIDCRERIIEIVENDGVILPRKRNKKNKEIPDFTKGVVEEMADRHPLIRLRRDGKSKAVAKFQNMAANMIDDRLPGQHIFYRALTGRFGGTNVQTQNMKRLPKGMSADDLTEDIEVDQIGSLVRCAVKSKRGVLVDADMSQIQARATFWLAGCHKVLDDFVNGRPMYGEMAAKIFDCKLEDIINPDTGKVWEGDPVAKERRQVGKVALLGLGFKMGVGKFIISAKTIGGVDIDYETAEKAVSVFRADHPELVKFWDEVERAAKVSMHNPQELIHVNDKVAFRRHGKRLTMFLPSGRELNYWSPRYEKEPGRYKPELIYDYGEKATVKPKRLYSSVFTENVAQGIEVDLLLRAMRRLRHENVVATVHDSIVLDVPEYDVERVSRLAREAFEPPEWAHGLPVAVDVNVSERLS